MAAEYIWHISDIHIGKVSDRYDEYRNVFDTLIATINTDPAKTIIVITGDTFDHKTKLSPDDIVLFKYLMNKLKYNVVIIPGNHDTNLNNPNATDLITPICDFPNVKYSTNTEIFNILGVNFVHISLLDPFPSADNIRNMLSVPNPILLYHGIVDGAKFGKHVETGRDITADIMSQAYLTLLGDVHEHAFITPYAAYAGSLIQQNRSESIIKGVILWNIPARSGTQVVIPNPHCIKIRTFGGDNLGTDLAQQHAQLKKLITDNTQSITITNITSAQGEKLEEEMKLIRNEFGKDVNIVNVLKTKTRLHISAIECFEHIVKSKSYPESVTNQIVEMYRRDSATSQKSSIWSVLSAKWSNILVYGDNNHIDFRNMQGITGVIAGNQMGKSSIIDVITFGLFGKPLRGDIGDMLRFGTKKLSVEVEFVVDGVNYLIKRQREGKNQPHVFMREETFIDPATNETKTAYKNITCQTIIETNNLIIDLIGTLDDFLSTGLYYDNRCDIIKMKPTLRIKELSRMFGLDNTELIRSSVSATIKEIKNAMSKIQLPTIENPQQLHDESSAELTASQLVQSELSAKLASYESAINDLRALQHSITAYNNAQNSLAKCNIDLEVCERKLTELKSQFEVQNEPVTPCVFDSADAAVYEKYCNAERKDLNALNNQLALLKSSIQQITRPKTPKSVLVQQLSKFDTQQTVDEVREQHLILMRDMIDIKNPIAKPTSTIESLNEQIALLQNIRIQTAQEYYDRRQELSLKLVKVVHVQPPARSRQDIQAEIESINATLPALRQTANISLPSVEEIEENISKFVPLQYTQNIEVLTEEILRIEQISAYKFNSQCQDCNRNIVTLASNLQTARSNLNKALAERKAIDAANIKINADLASLKNLLDKAKKISVAKHQLIVAESKLQNNNLDIKQHDDAERAAASIASNIYIVEQLEQLEKENNMRLKLSKLQEEVRLHSAYGEYASRKQRYDEITAELNVIKTNRNNLAEIKTITEAIAMHDAADAQSQIQHEIANLELEIATQTNINRVIAAHTAFTKYNNWLATQTMNNLQRQIYEIQGQKTILMAVPQPPMSSAEVDAELRTITTKQQAASTALQSEFVKAGKLMATLQQLSVEISRTIVKQEQFVPLEQRLNLHENYLTCLKPKELQLAIVTKHIKEIEDQMNKYLKVLTNFTIEFRTSDDSIDLYTKSLVSTCSIETISGFQSFVLSLVFRIVLTGILPRSADCIFIDEGFGVIDAENMQRMIKFLDEIASNYRFAFIISHVEELQAILQNPLNIIKTDAGHIINNTGQQSGEVQITNAKITCECGAQISPSSYNTHIASTKHKKIIEAKNAKPNANPNEILQEIETDTVAPYYNCECGAVIKNTKSSIKAHEASKRHGLRP